MAPGASPGLASSGSRSRGLGLAISRVEVLLLFFRGGFDTTCRSSGGKIDC